MHCCGYLALEGAGEILVLQNNIKGCQREALIKARYSGDRSDELTMDDSRTAPENGNKLI